MTTKTDELLDRARKLKRKNISEHSYVVNVSCFLRDILVKATCHRVIRTNRKAIRFLADR